MAKCKNLTIPSIDKDPEQLEYTVGRGKLCHKYFVKQFVTFLKC